MGLNRQTETDGALDGLAVQHRQYARQGQVNSTGLGIRLSAKGGRGTREDFRDGSQLRMRFDADDDFPLVHSFIRSETLAGLRFDENRPQIVECLAFARLLAAVEGNGNFFTLLPPHADGAFAVLGMAQQDLRRRALLAEIGPGETTGAAPLDIDV